MLKHVWVWKERRMKGSLVTVISDLNASFLMMGKVSEGSLVTCLMEETWSASDCHLLLMTDQAWLIAGAIAQSCQAG